MKTNFLKTWLTMLMLVFGMGVTWGEGVTIASWTYAARGANTEYAPTTNDASNSNAKLKSECALNTAGTSGSSSAYYGSWTNGKAVIITGLNMAGYTDKSIELTINLRHRYTGTASFYYSTDGTSYPSTANTTKSITNTSTDYTINSIPNNVKSIKVTISGNSAGNMWLGNVTIKGTVSGGGSNNEVTKYTVTWNVNGNTSTEQYAEGANITFPENPEDISSLKFRGWVSSPIEGTSTTEPTYTTSATMGNNDITYYAVFAKKTNGQDTDASVTISDYATANSWQGNGAVAYKSVTIDNNITATTTGTGNNGKYYSDWRMYQAGNGNVILTAADGYTLKSAKFTFTVANTGVLTYSGNAVKSATAVELSGKTATFTVGNSGSATNGQVKITKIEVTYLSEPTYSDFRTTVIERTLNGITLSGTYPTEFWKGETFTHEGLTVNANWNDGDEDVTSSAEFSEPDMNTVGEQTITVTYSTQSTTYNINIKTIANTAETAYTTTKAIELVDANKDLSTEVYVTGVVSNVESYNDTYHSITYWLDNNAFEVFSGKGIEGADFASINDIKVGATVVVKGIIKKYNSTYEFDKNNVLVSYTPPTVERTTATITFTSQNQNTLTVGNTDEYTVSYNGDGVLSVESSNTDAADVEISEGTVTVTAKAPGTTTITVSAPQTDNYTAATKSYTLTIKAAPKTFNRSTMKALVAEKDGKYYAAVNTLEGTNKFFLVKEVSVTNNKVYGLTDTEAAKVAWDINISGTEATVQNLNNEYLAVGTSTATTLSNVEVKLYTTGDAFYASQTGRGFAYNYNSGDKPRMASYNVSDTYPAAKMMEFGTADKYTKIDDIQFVAHNTAGYWATYSNDKDVFIAAADVYTVSVDNETIAMNTVDKEEVPALNNVSGTFVPANTGVLLFVETPVGHNPAEPVTVNAWTVANKTIPALDSNNMLYPSSKSMYDVNAAYYFKLAYDNYETQSGLGFYWGAQNGGAFTSKEGAAYLAVPSGIKARSFYLFDDSETTGVNNVNENVNENLNVYNLAGQRVAASQNGIMIINGKKVIK